MIIKIPTNTKTYLVSLMEHKIYENPSDSVFVNKSLYEVWYNPVDWYKGAVEKGVEIGKAIAGPSEEEKNKKQKEATEKEISQLKKYGEMPSKGGFGGGIGKEKTTKPRSFTSTLLGDSEEMTGEEENPMLKLLGAGGLMAAGGITKKGFDWAASAAKSLGLGGLGGYVAKGLASVGKQAEEISGKTWVEDQLANIGQSQMKLAAQGAGSPWTPFVVSNKKPQQILSRQQKEMENLKGSVEAEGLRRKARGYGLIP